MLKNKIIAVDIDDVISSCTESFIDYHNKVYNTNLKSSDIKYRGDYWHYWTFALSDLLQIDDLEAKNRFAEFVNSDSHIDGQTILPIVNITLKKLKKHFSLEIITARDIKMQDRTSAWIHSNLPSIFNTIHFTSDGQNRVKKSKVCREIGASYLIDDSVENCNDAADRGITALLFGEYGWNSHQDINSNVIRVKNWDDVLRFFEDSV